MWEALVAGRRACNFRWKITHCQDTIEEDAIDTGIITRKINQFSETDGSLPEHGSMYIVDLMLLPTG